MPKNAQHTPTPWEIWTSNSHTRITGPDGQDGGVLCAVIARDGLPVVSVRSNDAAFIVQACNAHDDLVEALETAIRWLRNQENQYPGCLNEDAISKRLEPALKKAGTR